MNKKRSKLSVTKQEVIECPEHLLTYLASVEEDQINEEFHVNSIFTCNDSS